MRHFTRKQRMKLGGELIYPKATNEGTIMSKSRERLLNFKQWF